MEKIFLSVVVIAKNEEACIAECLESVHWADEIVVVDDESTDKTVEIVKKYTGKIFHRKMDVEGKHRNWAYAQASNSWVLSLDADEKVTPELRIEIEEAIKADKYVAYDIPLRNFIGNYWIKYGGWYPASKVRLFKKDKFKYEEVEVHPRAYIDGACGHLKGDIIHKGYPDIEHFLNSVNRQSTLEAKKWIYTGRTMTLGRAIWRAVDRFFRRYLRKKAYKDGMHGFIVAFFDTLYQILSYAKYLELRNKNNTRNISDRRMLICPVCSNNEWSEAYRIKEWTIGECTVCGFARIDPLPALASRPEEYSQEKVINRNTKKLTPTQKLSRKMKQFFNKLTNRDKGRIFLKKLFLYLSPGARVLDIGCGDGSLIKQAKERFNCTGLEISGYLASLAKKSGLNIIVGNFLLTDFANEKYDGITSISLLEHLDDPELAMKKCFSLLNKGGVLLIKTVNYGCLNRVIKRGNWTGFRPPDHIVYFTPLSLKRLLKKIGFAKIKIYSWSFNDNMYCDAWK
jgi:glycosyltransferase involved in cell wall biosynthesis/2-polyprenyl-3-methyl-5-hydroxy-6-metoxy-1,4-benzoquinol methylase